MTKSMTGYGRAPCLIGEEHYLLEIHAVNKKSLDVHLMMPKEFLGLDVEMRKWAHEAVDRGQLTVKVSKECSQDLQDSMPSQKAMLSFKKKWEEYALALGYNKEDITLDFLSKQMEKISRSSPTDLDLARIALKTAFAEAITSFNHMRDQEGKALEIELLKRLEIIQESLKKVEIAVPKSREMMKTKLHERFKELQLLGVDGEDRLHREMVIFAERVDITEEIVRLTSHLKQFRDAMQSIKRGLGKTLEFLTLEMNRETHTIASKSQDLDVTSHALMIKVELEKIREQIQNIE